MKDKVSGLKKLVWHCRQCDFEITDFDLREPMKVDYFCRNDREHGTMTPFKTVRLTLPEEDR